jgi:hypothetical protein
MRVVVMCCLCEKVFDDMEQEMGKSRWKECESYMAQYQLKRSHIRMFHGFCPDCLRSYRAFLAGPIEQRRTSRKEEKA